MQSSFETIDAERNKLTVSAGWQRCEVVSRLDRSLPCRHPVINLRVSVAEIQVQRRHELADAPIGYRLRMTQGKNVPAERIFRRGLVTSDEMRGDASLIVIRAGFPRLFEQCTRFVGATLDRHAGSAQRDNPILRVEGARSG